MERVTFIVERSGQRIPCMLNPETLEVRRSAGLARRRSAGGALIGNPRSDDPLVATGGGITEYQFNLLFDVEVASLLSAASAQPIVVAGDADQSMAIEEPADTTGEPAEGGDTTTPDATGSAADTRSEPVPVEPTDPLPPVLPEPTPPSVDVRTLTQPLWSLAENGEPNNRGLAPQRVRFIWGRSWNVPGVIVAVAERHERFDEQGVPQRSWMSLLMRRVDEASESADEAPQPTSPQFEVSPPDSSESGNPDESVVLPVDEEGYAMTPLHVVAAERYGDPRYDRAIAEYNNLDDLLQVEEGQPIRLPQVGTAEGAGAVG